MRGFVLFLAMATLAWLGSVSPAPAGDYIPAEVETFINERPRYTGRPALRTTTPRGLTKGEYYCGHNKICRLKPGEVPKQCPKGMCQYPLGGPDLIGNNAQSLTA